MPDAVSEARLSAALDKVIAKLERHQQANGTWGMHGWAPPRPVSCCRTTCLSIPSPGDLTKTHND
jgi:hypothetical protein